MAIFENKSIGSKILKQHPIWLYIADFYCHELKLVMEIDGSIHNLKEVIDHDIIREESIVSFGTKVIRFKNSELRMGIEEVINKIEDVINELKANGNNQEKQN